MVQGLELSSTAGELRATGVKVRVDGGEQQVFKARREVVLSAGSIGSPQLLQLSGIGPRPLLEQQGIAVQRELPGVGENLQDHLQIRTVYAVSNTTTLNKLYNSLWGKLKMGLQYLLFRTGPMTMPPSQLGAFAKSDPQQATPNLEWHVQPLSLDKFGDPLHSFNAITPSVCNLRPSSRGHVRITSASPEQAPEIRLNYLSTEEDRKVAVEGLRFTRRIMAADALRGFAPEELKPGTDIQSEEDLARAAGDLGTTIFHPVGTCKMGSDAMAVVDDRLRVLGVQGLRVIDASIMPTIPSGNTNAPTVMIAEKGAEFILGNE
jgi:choline dehydrogenase